MAGGHGLAGVSRPSLTVVYTGHSPECRPSAQRSSGPWGRHIFSSQGLDLFPGSRLAPTVPPPVSRSLIRSDSILMTIPCRRLPCQCLPAALPSHVRPCHAIPCHAVPAAGPAPHSNPEIQTCTECCGTCFEHTLARIGVLARCLLPAAVGGAWSSQPRPTPREHPAAAAAAAHGRPCRARARRWMGRDAWSRFCPLRLETGPRPFPPRGNCGRRWRAGLAVPAGRAAVRAFCLKDWLTRGTLYIDAFRRSEALAGPTSKALSERTIIGLLGSTIWARPLGHPPVSHLIKGRVPVRPLSGPSASRARGGGSKRKVCGTPAARQAPAPTAAPTAASNTERGGHDDDKTTTTTTTTNPEGAEGVIRPRCSVVS